MSKAYLLLIAGLLIVALGIGAFAYTRSKSPAAPTLPSTVPSAQPTQPSAAVPIPNEIALTITSPKNSTQVSTPTITVTGKTVPSADVSVNEKDLKADAAGNFTATITLEEGDNIILVTAANDQGLSSEAELTVTYTPAQ